jgi:hypothetical protein
VFSFGFKARLLIWNCSTYQEDIVGKVQGWVRIAISHISILAKSVFYIIARFLPKVGMVTIVMNDYPRVKFLLLAVLGVFGEFQIEQILLQSLIPFS